MMITLVRTVLKTFDFKGRASRRELLFYLVFVCSVYFLNEGVEYPGMSMRAESSASMDAGFWLCIVPLSALIVRRVHDIGCSACVVLAWLVPFSGVVIHVWMLMSKGDPEENYYGLPPRY